MFYGGSCPVFYHLVIGDVGDTIPGLAGQLKDMPLAFVSGDVDCYSSPNRAMRPCGSDAGCCLPAMPAYFDNMTTMLTWNERCGEKLAIREFNEENSLRKMTGKDNFNIPRFHVLQVLDHPPGLDSKIAFGLSAGPHPPTVTARPHRPSSS